MLKITKEIAYRYLKDSMFRYDNFTIVNIFTEPASIWVNEHPVIIIEYKEYKDGSFRTVYKNIHINLSRFGDWIKANRENILDELLK